MSRNAPTITPAFDPLERLAELRKAAEEGQVGPDSLALTRLTELHGRASEARRDLHAEPGVVSRAVRGDAPLGGDEREREGEHGGAAALGLFDAEGGVEPAAGKHDGQGVAEAASPVAALARATELPGRVGEEPLGVTVITPFVQRVREACGELRPRYWFLINTLEGNDGAAESWGERIESEVVLRRFEWLKSAYRAVLDPNAAEADLDLYRLLGARGDEFAAWIECEPSELVELLEKCA